MHNHRILVIYTCVYGCVCVFVCVVWPAFSYERRVGPPPVWAAGGEHYLWSLRRPVSRASVWGTCKLPSLEYLFTKQMFLSGAITFGLHFPVAHWYRWMCIQRRPELCMVPLGATHLIPSMLGKQASQQPSGLPQRATQTQPQLHCGNRRKSRRHFLRRPQSDGEMACISFSPLGCSFALEREGERESESGMERRSHACFCPPLNVMNNLAVQCRALAVE